MHKIRAREVVRHVKDINKPVVCEIGVFAGRMSRAMLELKPDMRLYLIDPWSSSHSSEGYRETGDFHADMSQREHDRYYRVARDAVQGFDATIVRKYSADAAEDFPDAFFDLVFIDGDHSYEGCRADIINYLPKVKPGGYLSGHDYNNFDYNFGVNHAVDEFVTIREKELELGKNFTWFVRV